MLRKKFFSYLGWNNEHAQRLAERYKIENEFDAYWFSHERKDIDYDKSLKRMKKILSKIAEEECNRVGLTKETKWYDVCNTGRKAYALIDSIFDTNEKIYSSVLRKAGMYRVEKEDDDVSEQHILPDSNYKKNLTVFGVIFRHIYECVSFAFGGCKHYEACYLRMKSEDTTEKHIHTRSTSAYLKWIGFSDTIVEKYKNNIAFSPRKSTGLQQFALWMEIKQIVSDMMCDETHNLESVNHLMQSFYPVTREEMVNTVMSLVGCSGEFAHAAATFHRFPDDMNEHHDAGELGCANPCIDRLLEEYFWHRASIAFIDEKFSHIEPYNWRNKITQSFDNEYNCVSYRYISDIPPFRSEERINWCNNMEHLLISVGSRECNTTMIIKLESSLTKEQVMYLIYRTLAKMKI